MSNDKGIRSLKYQICYFFFQRHKAILLHTFMKKSRAIPEKDLRIVENRKDVCDVIGKYKMLEFEE